MQGIAADVLSLEKEYRHYGFANRKITWRLGGSDTQTPR
jgi:hypothetical protein